MRIPLAFDNARPIFVQEHVEEDIVAVILDRIKIHRTELGNDVYRDIVNQGEVHIDLRKQHNGVQNLVRERRKTLECTEREGQIVVVEPTRMIVYVLHDVHRIRKVWKDVQMHYGRPQKLNNK